MEAAMKTQWLPLFAIVVAALSLTSPPASVKDEGLSQVQ
jgi:hypothetical protein